MSSSQPDPRADLSALCARGFDWHGDGSRRWPESSGARRAAVLVLFGALDAIPASSPTSGARSGPPRAPADLDVLLIRRAATLRSHPGQIAFPGGGIDASDRDPTAAALREAREETGLRPENVEVIGILAELPLAVSKFVVTPVVAWWTRPSELAAVDHAETVDVFRTPVAELLDPAHRLSTEHATEGRTVRMPAFLVDGRLIWGFTALVLSRMFDELEWAVPWDAERIVDPFA